MRVSVKRPFKRRDSGLIPRRRFCRLCVDKVKTLDYKDVRRLEGFIRERGKIISVRVSGNCAKHQRRITEVIKKARFMALLPYVRQ